MSKKKNDRADNPDFQGWQRRHEIRRSSAASPVPNGRGKEERREKKHPKKIQED